MVMSRYPLARRAGVELGWILPEFCSRTGVDPHMVTRFVALGLLAPVRDHAGADRFTSAHAAQLARIQRLRAGLGLNYTAVGVVLDLLDRIEDLEAALRTTRRAAQQNTRYDLMGGDGRWT